METKDYLIGFIAIALIVGLGYVFYVSGIGLMGNPPAGNHTGTSNETNITGEQNAEAGALLMATIAKPSYYDRYTYTYTDDIGRYISETRMVQAPGFSIVQVKSPIFEKTVYSNASGDVLCITFGSNVSCSAIGQNSTMSKSVADMKAGLFAGRAGKDVRAVGIYLKKGAIKFIGSPAINTQYSEPCTEIKYSLDYSGLTIQDLNDVGVAASDPAVLYSKNYVFDYCIRADNTTKAITLDYTYLGGNMTTKTIITEAKWGIADSSQFVYQELSPESQTEQLFLDALSARQSVLYCENNATTRDECVKTYSIQNKVPYVCLLAGAKKDICILSIAPRYGASALCPEMGNESGRDDCWMESATASKNASLCSGVTDSAKRANCISLVSGALNISAKECIYDADCFTAGCSSQMCVPNEKKEIITTCDYQPEYACLNRTGCGCVQGMCAWKPNAQYTTCLAGISKNNTK